MKFTKGSTTINFTSSAIVKDLSDQPINIKIEISTGAMTSEFSAKEAVEILLTQMSNVVTLFKGFITFQKQMRSELVEWLDTAIANAPKVVKFMENPTGEETKAENEDKE